MSLVLNIALVVGGAFLADLCAFFLAAHLGRAKRAILGVIGLGGLVLILSRIPSSPDAQLASIASASYALFAAGATAWTVAPLLRRVETYHALRVLSVVLSAITLAVSGLVMMVARIAP